MSMDDSHSERMKIKVKGQDDIPLTYSVKPDTQVGKLMTAYCEKKQLDSKTVQFLFLGKRITNKKLTMERLGVKDGDEIDAMMHVNGGS